MTGVGEYLAHPVKLDLRLIEVDQVASPTWRWT